MEILKIIFLVFLFVYLLVFFIFAVKTKALLKTIILNALIGNILILLINLSVGFTGLNVPVNEFTVLSSSVFGMPGVLAILLFNIIFF